MGDSTQSSATAAGPRPLLTIDEVARFLGVSRRQVYLLLAQGELVAVRVGQRLRFRPDDLESRFGGGAHA